MRQPGKQQTLNPTPKPSGGSPNRRDVPLDPVTLRDRDSRVGVPSAPESSDSSAERSGGFFLNAEETQRPPSLRRGALAGGGDEQQKRDPASSAACTQDAAEGLISSCCSRGSDAAPGGPWPPSPPCWCSEVWRRFSRGSGETEGDPVAAVLWPGVAPAAACSSCNSVSFSSMARLQKRFKAQCM